MLTTARLDLIPGTIETLTAALEGPGALAASLGLEVPADWPPALFDAQAMRVTRDWLRCHPQHAGWGPYFLVLRERPVPPDGHSPIVVGVGGFKGPPDEAGLVEIGYSVLSRYRRLGLATEAVGGWLRLAFGEPEVTGVVAQTLPSLQSSIRVLEKAGFVLEGEGDDPDGPGGEVVLRYGRHRARSSTGALDLPCL